MDRHYSFIPLGDRIWSRHPLYPDIIHFVNYSQTQNLPSMENPLHFKLPIASERAGERGPSACQTAPRTSLSQYRCPPPPSSAGEYPPQLISLSKGSHGPLPSSLFQYRCPLPPSSAGKTPPQLISLSKGSQGPLPSSLFLCRCPPPPSSAGKTPPQLISLSNGSQGPLPSSLFQYR